MSRPEKSLCSLVIPSRGVIPYRLVRSKRRTLQITIKESLEVNVAAPVCLSQQKIEDFINEKSAWIFKKLSEKRSFCETWRKRGYAHGEEFLFLGKKYPIHVLEQNVVKPWLIFDNARWLIAIPSSFSDQGPQIKEQLIRWYRHQAEEVLGTRLFHLARTTGLKPQKVVIKTQKTLWGSCSSRTRSIQLNWKLILAPFEVIDYVIVHELTHLAIPNHSQRFWQKVKSILPDFKERQQWLKRHQHDLALP